MALWNKKGIVITAISGLVGLIVSSKLEEGLTSKFNPELKEAREDFKNAALEGLKTNHGSNDIFESTNDNIVNITAEEEEVPE